MKAISRVVVDECLGQASTLLEPLRRLLGSGPIEFLFVAVEHPGISDIEILERLLNARSALLTKDRVLHNLALGRSLRSFVYTPESGLTDRRLDHVSTLDRHLPVRVASSAARDGDEPRSAIEARAITGCFAGLLSERQLEQFRTKRRRIRAHFGSSGNIAAVAMTIAQRRTARGMVGGYMMKVDAHHGIKGLFPASEGWFLERNAADGLLATCWALLHLFQLRLQSHPVTLYHLDGAALAQCIALIAEPGSGASAVERMTGRLLAAAAEPRGVTCVKGRFFDRTSAKLSQLTKFDTNELVSTDLQAMVAALTDSTDEPYGDAKRASAAEGEPGRRTATPS
jgi:hypothetical protein